MISETARSLSRSGIREVMDLAWRHPGCIRLEVGEPNFPTPSHIVEAAVEALHAGQTKYAPNAGLPELREAIVSKLARRNGIAATVEQVVVTVGAVQALFSTLLALTEPGDRVLVPDPGWPNYSMMAHLLHLGQDRYSLRAGNDYLPDLAEIEQLVTGRTRAIVVNSPSNPLGTIIPAEVLTGLVELAERHGLYLVSDEAYEDITFEPGFSSPASAGGSGRVVSIYTCSKSYAMTGWRVGYAAVPTELGAVMHKLQEPQISCVNTASQWAALAALSGPQDCVAEMTATYGRRRDALSDLLGEHGVAHVRPGGAFYTWVALGEGWRSSSEFARQLLAERAVAVAPGSAFGPGGEGHVRLSLAADEELLLKGAALLAEQLSLARPDR